MKKLACGPALAWPLHAAAGETADDPLAVFGWFRDLPGACRTGAHPDGKTRDTQCYTQQYGRVIRGTIRVSGTATFEGDSVFAWDGRTKKILYAQWADTGAMGHGEAFLEGDSIVFYDPPKPGADRPDMRSRWSKVDADAYRVTRDRRDGEAWTEVFSVTCNRER